MVRRHSAAAAGLALSLALGIDITGRADCV